MSLYVEYSKEDMQFVGKSRRYRSLSYLADTADEAMEGIKELVQDVEREARENQTLFDLTDTVL